MAEVGDKDDPYGEKYIKEMIDRLKMEPPQEAVVPNILPRSEWDALPPKDTVPLIGPIQVALFTHTETEECQTQEECFEFLRKKQKEDMEERELTDIQYNFYIGGDGTIYEGRGWQVEADKDDHNTDIIGLSVDIAYIGNFEHKELSKELIDIGCNIAKYGQQIGFLHQFYNITTYWEDHVHILGSKTSYNPLDDPSHTPWHRLGEGTSLK